MRSPADTPIKAKVNVLNQQLKTIRARKNKKLKREESPITVPDKNDEVIEISDRPVQYSIMAHLFTCFFL